MELLTIEHIDFTMIVECTKFDRIWSKAKSNVGEDKLLSTYSWSEGAVSVKRTAENGTDISIEQGVPAPAVFFDNADYPIWIEFGSHVKNAQFGSILQNDNDRFSFRRHILAGFINYKNEIGRSEYSSSTTPTRRLRHSVSALRCSAPSSTIMSIGVPSWRI